MQTQTAIPKLRFSLANNALIHFFNSQYWIAEEVEFTRSFCQIFNSDRIWKLKFRLLREENNDMIIASVFADLNNEERIFIYERYCH